MAKKESTVNLTQAADDLRNLLRVFKNADTVIAALEEAGTAENRAKEAEARRARLSAENDDLLVAMAKLRSDANDEVVAAKAEASKTLTDAKAKAAKLVEDATARGAAMLSEAQAEKDRTDQAAAVAHAGLLDVQAQVDAKAD
ncbi:MAG: hypothetical protein ACRCXM_15780, partial [Beijerinckiaceae bacterium]